MATNTNIKQIQTSTGTHEIDARYWGGHEFSEISDLVHGVVDTFVIPAQDNAADGSDYKKVVESSDAQVETTVSKLATLVGRPINFDKFGVGDVILMGARSDGTKNFDRWISDVSGDVIKLDVLETQVAAHHHTISIATSSGKVLTGLASGNPKTVTLTSVGSAVNVLTGASGTFVTSVSYDANGNDDLSLSSSSASGSVASHSHTVTAHSHSFTPSSLVSQTASAFTSFTSAKHNIHSHTVVSAAGKWTNGTAFNVATGVSASDTFIKNLKDSSNQTTGANTAGLTAKANTAALATSAQTSSDKIGEVVKTTSAGSHTHNVTTTTDVSVVTGVTVAASVVTSVKITHTKPTVAANVVTDWSCSVDNSGILSFTATSTTQSAGTAATIEAPRSAQSYASAKVTATGAAASAGAHQHGFSHTHAIPSHTHSIDNHTHTYVKTIMSETGVAITSLSMSSYIPHTHSANISAASTAADVSEVNIVTGGSQTEVVRNLKTSDFSTETSSPTTDTKYVALVGEITFPGLIVNTASVSTSTSSITPAVAGTQKAISGITFTSANFIKTVTSGSAIKTTKNIGGNPS